MSYVHVSGIPYADSSRGTYYRRQAGLSGLGATPAQLQAFVAKWGVARAKIVDAAQKFKTGSTDEQVLYNTLMTSSLIRLDASVMRIATGDLTLVSNFKHAVEGTLQSLSTAEPSKVALATSAWNEAAEELETSMGTTAGNIVDKTFMSFWTNLSMPTKLGVGAGAVFVGWRLLR